LPVIHPCIPSLLRKSSLKIPALLSLNIRGFYGTRWFMTVTAEAVSAALEFSSFFNLISVSYPK
jgi:hypothetical protein